VVVAPDQIPQAIVTDPDDNAILVCAFIGRASYIVTYDPHFDALGGDYQGIPILDGLHFLYIVRGDRPPDLLS
jgi:predicted nucleic acid-binding protein